jgi:hypothetical protein
MIFQIYIMNWWHDDMSSFASQLSSGVLNEMKRRILSSNIQKEKLTLTESGDRMKRFFQREIERYKKRKDAMNQKQKQSDQLQTQLEKYQQALTKILQCNLELAKKCRKHGIEIQKVSIIGSAFSYI